MSLRPEWVQTPGSVVCIAYPAYSGTTVENFLACAETYRGNVSFNKLREPKHQEERIVCTPSLDNAVQHSLLRAQELNHRPLIIGGMIRDGYVNFVGGNSLWLRRGLKWPIQLVYFLKEVVNLQEVPPWMLNSSHFLECSPQEALKRFRTKT